MTDDQIAVASAPAIAGLTFGTFEERVTTRAC
jgi:hypothetical protein